MPISLRNLVNECRNITTTSNNDDVKRLSKVVDELCMLFGHLEQKVNSADRHAKLAKHEAQKKR
jgi:outer membrane murein-binding lipoprotein Lpp